ncbi:hypothetical protein EG329_001938 [Mollisiaceae sp. DMI_Dod_QoI]|nr:hypothetical protein EG329_001938 [Helotiales sp. DMI_Dod_QoI]
MKLLRYAGRRTQPAHIYRSLFRTFAASAVRAQPTHNSDLVAIDAYYRLKDTQHRIEQHKKGTWPSSTFSGKEGVKEAKQKKYILPMFPYPSGDLHLGHLRVYTISDVLARFHRMQGYDVIHPIGWDGFGLPAENAAIERGIDPATWTKKNIQKMKSQLEDMNGSWDWDKEFSTCNPQFYKHTQQLFLLLHKAGLAYQAESMVNYDPVDKTVLANEQVDANGCSWRSGAKVEQKMLKQWFFRITHFRQELLDGLETLEKGGAWPERVLAMQKNWLGKSTGAKVKFPVVAYDQQTHSDIEVFTTRPDTLFGAQYVALASTHPIVQSLAKSDVELQAFLDTIPALPADSKVGYLLPHVRALNPLAYEESTPDATKASLPIYVAPYVLGDYGDGAVMGVPGHDIRDHAFWKHNRYDDPVRMVISQSPDESTNFLDNAPYVHHGHLTKHSGPYAGLHTAQATKKIIGLLQAKGLGSAAETWRLRDWLVSRQRYWGTPIPIIHCDSCGPIPVPEDQLPVELPPVQDHWDNGKTGNPLDHAHDWVNTKCPECGGAAKRDTDTMDTFVDSSWYFMRFPDAHNKDFLFSPEAADANLPVDIYIGGVEHAILHLLYARFISKFLSTTPYWPTGYQHAGEPFKKVLTQGMVHGKTYSDPSNGRFLKPDEIDLSDLSQPKVISTGEKANVSFEKMSKSKFNGVDPSTCMLRYGADATRAHILFQAPVSEVLEWDQERIVGVTRWLRRLLDFIDKHASRWGLVEKHRPFNAKEWLMRESESIVEVNEVQAKTQQNQLLLDLKEKSKSQAEYESLAAQVDEALSDVDMARKPSDVDKALWRTVQATIASVTASYSKSHSLNTVVSDLMSLTNAILDHEEGGRSKLKSNPQLVHHAVVTLLKMMAPITPAVAEFAWDKLSLSTADPIQYYINEADIKVPNPTTVPFKAAGSIFDQPFPTMDDTYEMLAPATQKCAIQINGKFRIAVDVPKPPLHLSKEELGDWLVKEILQTKYGKENLMGAMKNGRRTIDISQAKRTIVVQGGKTVNFSY